VGGQRGYADWTDPDHRLRRLLSEFIGISGLTFVLSGGAAILIRYGGHSLQPWQTALVLSLISALWLVVAVYFLGDISAHFNPATTLAFALRKDMDWVMACVYWVGQFAAAACGSLLARAFFGADSSLAATVPLHGMSWQAAGFEAIITFGLVLMILNLANGPKLNGPFVPLAIGAYIMAWGTMGGPFEGASMNPARSFEPDLAKGNLSTWWVYLIGPAAGASSRSLVPTCCAVPRRRKSQRPPRETPSTEATRSYPCREDDRLVLGDRQLDLAGVLDEISLPTGRRGLGEKRWRCS
jgi:glycerol uptake facilitator-like aquaporin